MSDNKTESPQWLVNLVVMLVDIGLVWALVWMLNPNIDSGLVWLIAFLFSSLQASLGAIRRSL